MNLRLEGKHALVGGGSQGIGRAIAHELASLGASVTVLARTASTLQKVVEQLPRTEQQTHHYLVVDFADAKALQTQVATHVATHPVHILVNNTGGPAAGPVHQATPEAFVQAYNNHLLCNHLLMQVVLDGMKAAKYGRIINVISTSVKVPLSNLGVSNTTRGAVANWAKTLANELGVYGITVNNVLPGATATGRLSSIIENKAQKAGIEEADVEAQMKKAIPLGRFAAPEEVAAAAAFLASPAAAYITGINLPVDGGRTPAL